MYLEIYPCYLVFAADDTFISTTSPWCRAKNEKECFWDGIQMRNYCAFAEKNTFLSFKVVMVRSDGHKTCQIATETADSILVKSFKQLNPSSVTAVGFFLHFLRHRCASVKIRNYIFCSKLFLAHPDVKFGEGIPMLLLHSQCSSEFSRWNVKNGTNKKRRTHFGEESNRWWKRNDSEVQKSDWIHLANEALSSHRKSSTTFVSIDCGLESNRHSIRSFEVRTRKRLRATEARESIFAKNSVKKQTNTADIRQKSVHTSFGTCQQASQASTENWTVHRQPPPQRINFLHSIWIIFDGHCRRPTTIIIKIIS